MMTTADEQAVTVLLAEYDRIKSEQMARIAHRDNLIYAVLGSMAAVVAVAVTARTPALLLAVPLASVVLGWTHLANDHMVSAIGRYVRNDLEPRVAALIHGDGTGPAPLFGWENDHKGDRRRRSRKVFQLVVDLTAFILPPLAAIGIVWTLSPQPVVIIAGAVELVMVAVLAFQMTAYAELRRHLS